MDSNDELRVSKPWAFQPLVMREHKARGKESPKGRSGHRIVCDEQNLYSFGGFNPCVEGDGLEIQPNGRWAERSPLFKEIWKFNFLSERWQRLPTHKDMPGEVASSAVVLKNRMLIVYGGTGVPFSRSCSNKLHVCDLRTGEMRLLPSMGVSPEPHYGQAMIPHGPFLYTVGGTTGYDYTCDIHRYDLRSDKWESVYICCGRSLAEPKGRYRHELAFDGNFIYVLGGGTATEAFDFEEIPAFDLQANQWTVVSAHKDPEYDAVPAPRRCHGCVQYTDERTGVISIVISGGYTEHDEFSDVWRLDLKKLQWTCLVKCSLPSPMYFHSVALTPQGRMYTFGGIIKTAGATTRTNAVYSTWLAIPKLQEICWEALNHYVKNLSRRSRHELAVLGVPLEFLQRLENADR